MKTTIIVTKRLVYFVLIISVFKSFSQDKLLHIKFQDCKVFKNSKTNTFQIQNNETIVYDKLKFVGYAENVLQVLSNTNKLFYLNHKLEIISFPEKVETLYCGTVDDFMVKIIEKNTHYLIEKTIDPIDSRQSIKTEVIDSISKRNINDIYFLNKKKIIHYDENFFFPETLIIKTGSNKTGIRSNKTTKYYDDVDFTNPFAIKIKKNDLYGYYGITKIKYLILNKFVFNLASFELENGQKGYIDLNGNEY